MGKLSRHAKAPRVRGDTAGKGGSGGAERLTRGRRWRFRQRGLLPYSGRDGALEGLLATERRADSVRRLEVFGGAFCPENLLIGGICTAREMSRLRST